MARRLSRFLHLERARASRSAATPPRHREAERFEGLEPDAAAPTDLRSAAGHLARFDERGDESLPLHASSDGDAPSIRCIRCEAESGRFESRCTACGADFDTAEQRAFNEQQWAQRRAQLEEERARHDARRRAEMEDAVQAAQERRRYYEDLARQVGRETRARLEGDRWERVSGWLGRGGGPRGVRFNLGVGGVAIALLFIAAGLTGGTRAVGRLLVMIAIVGVVIAVRWFLGRR